jgi:hypothetical protein
MTIETKYNIGDEVWVMFDGEPLCGRIVECRIHCNYGRHITRVYVVCDIKDRNRNNQFFEYAIFKTKEELIKSL